MASPIRPSDIKDTLPTTDGSACARLKKVIVDFPRRVYEWFSYIYNEDGTFTEEFKTDLCAVKCDDILVDDNGPNDDDDEPGGQITAPVIRVGAAMRHGGAIPVVWEEVSAATKYDIYRGTTNVKDASTTVRLRKDLVAAKKNIQQSVLNNGLALRPGNMIMFLDVHGGWKYTPNVGEEKTNTLAGGTPYYYWVVAKNDSGARSSYSSSTENIGFSRYVTNYTAIGSPKLLWTGQTETATSGLADKTRLRLLLRGGGGAGGGGGDWTLPTWTKYYIKNVAYDAGTQKVTLTFYQEGSNVTDFEADDEITLEGTGLAAWNKGGYKIEAVKNQADEIELKAIGSPPNGATFNLPDLVSAENGGKVPGTTNITYYGRAYATKHKLPQRIPGGGGGGGGMLQAVFALTEITDVRVRTLDWNDVEVNYNPSAVEENAGTYDHLCSIDTDNLMGEGQGEYYAFNEGGMGRLTTGGDPAKAGEPRSTAGHHGQPAGNDNNTSNTGPYKTVFEVKKASTWYLVAWVSDGEGGGHADTGPLTRDSTGGKGAVPILYKASDTATGLGDKFGTTPSSTFIPYAAATADIQAVKYGIKDHSGVCVLRAAALGGKGSKYFPPGDGSEGHFSKSHGSGGTKGWGGHAWDSVQPASSTIVHEDWSFPAAAKKSSDALDLQAPGSGGNCSAGTADESIGPKAWGGHALAGCAYLTYAEDTDYDTA